MTKEKMQMSYLERITLNEEEKSSEEKYFQNQKARLQWESDLLSTESQVVKTKRELDTLLRAEDLNSGDIMKASDILDGYKRGLDFLQKMYTVLFPPPATVDKIVDETIDDQKEEISRS